MHLASPLTIGCLLTLCTTAGVSQPVAGPAQANTTTPVSEVSRVAAQQFDDLFAARMEAAVKSRSTEDDLALAREMLQAAALEGISDELRLMCAEKALALASRDAQGFDTAEQALTRLEHTPGVWPMDVLDQRASLYLSRFGSLRGDLRTQFAAETFNALRALAEAQEAAMQLNEAQLTWRKASPVANVVGKTARDILREAAGRLATKSRQERALARVIAVYEANPRPDLAARIARSYLIDFDAPGHALLYAAAGEDGPAKRFMPILAGPADELPTDAALELGEWLETLLPEAADDAGRAALLRRADTAYSTFLERATEENFAVAKARIAQTRVAEELEKLGLTTGHISGGIDLMPVVGRNLHLIIGGDETRHKHWSVDVQRKQLVGRMGNEDRYAGHPLNLPLRATGDYVLNLRLGVDERYAVIVLPVGDKLARVVYTASPSSQIGGEADPQRKTDQFTGTFNLTAPPTEPGQVRKLTFDVRTQGDAAGMVVKIDDQIALQWQGPYAPFDVGPNEKFELASQFAIAPPRNGQIRIEAINAKGAVRLLTPTPQP